MRSVACAILSTAALAPAAFAAPSPWGWGRGGVSDHGKSWGHGGSYDHGKWWNGKDDDEESCEEPDTVIPFTSTYHVIATPGEVVNGTTPTGGLPGSIGHYDFGINSDLDLICYYIRIQGFTGEYLSPAKTATHIHEAAKGASGPPRLAFPNPVDNGKGERVSVGCLQGPFLTGVNDTVTGQDTGVGFMVAEIEAKPAAFFADVHSSNSVAGAVRGQLG